MSEEKVDTRIYKDGKNLVKEETKSDNFFQRWTKTTVKTPDGKETVRVKKG